MASPIEKLPPELFCKIMQYVAEDDARRSNNYASDAVIKPNKVKLSPYATVSRNWQVMIESMVLCFQNEPLRIKPGEIRDFGSVFLPERRRALLQRIRLEMVVWDYCEEIGCPILDSPNSIADMPNVLQSIIESYVSRSFVALLKVLGHWKHSKAQLELEYVVGITTSSKVEDGAPVWISKEGLELDLEDAPVVSVVCRFIRSKGTSSMGFSPCSLNVLLSKFDNLRHAEIDLPMNRADDKLLRLCHGFVAHQLRNTCPFLTVLHLDLGHKGAKSFADCERAFRYAIVSLFDIGEQLVGLRLVNVVNPGEFIVQSLLDTHRNRQPTWPKLASFEISGFYQRQMEGDLVRENGKFRVVKEMCPNIMQFKLEMLVWHKIRPGWHRGMRCEPEFTVAFQR